MNKQLEGIGVFCFGLFCLVGFPVLSRKIQNPEFPILSCLPAAGITDVYPASTSLSNCPIPLHEFIACHCVSHTCFKHLVFPQPLVFCGCCLTSLLSLSFLLHAYLMGFIHYFIFSSLCMLFLGI